jgi:UDP-GlcNAc:undecaprenyl-phosphate GlcNAc-1-phosphate transferase
LHTRSAGLLLSPTLTICAASFAATALLTRFARALCRALGLIDVPDARKQHRTATPLLGGLALVIVMLPLAMLATWLAWRGEGLSSMLLLTLATAAITLVGIADDRHSLSPSQRVILGFLVFGGLAAADPSFMVRALRFPLLGFELGLAAEPVAVFFTALCCVGLVNAVNMADGKNGLVMGLGIGWLILIGLRAPPNDLPFIAVLLAGLIALLVTNLRGRLFLGDGGAYGLAAAIGLLAIRTYNASPGSPGHGLNAEGVVLLFVVPVLDSFRLTFRRLARGQSPMAADRDHLHHYLQERFGWPNGLYVYLAAGLLPATVLLVLTS